jgi:hypothetical protein
VLTDGPQEPAAQEVAVVPEATPDTGMTAAAWLDPLDEADVPEELETRVPEPAAKPDVEAIFARLAAEYQHPDPVSPWADRLADRSTRVVVMVVGGLGSAVLLFALLWLLSLLG